MVVIFQRDWITLRSYANPRVRQSPYIAYLRSTTHISMVLSLACPPRLRSVRLRLSSNSQHSAFASVSEETGPPSAPARPTQPVISSTTAETMLVTWAAQQIDGGARVSHYHFRVYHNDDVRYGDLAGDNDMAVASFAYTVSNTTSQQFSTRIHGLLARTQYVVTVSAENSAGLISAAVHFRSQRSQRTLYDLLPHRSSDSGPPAAVRSPSFWFARANSGGALTVEFSVEVFSQWEQRAI